MKRMSFFLLVIGGILLLSSLFSPGLTGAHPALQVTITPTAFNYLPFVAKNWSPPPTPGLLFASVLDLDGIDDYAIAPDSSNLDVGDEASESLTLEAWFRADDVNPSPSKLVVIAQKWNSYALLVTLGPARYIDCLELRLYTAPGTYFVSRICSSLFFSPGWHHVAGVFDNDTNWLSLYLVGQRLADPASFTETVYNSGDAFTVGGLPGGNWLAGCIEEVRLSVSARYTGTTYAIPGRFACDERTRALWHFDETSGSTIMFDGEDKDGSNCGGIEDTLTGMNGAVTGP